MQIVIGLAFLMVGLAALAGSVSLVWGAFRKLRAWVRIIGTIAGYAESKRDGSVYFRAEIRFEPMAGQAVVFTSGFGSTRRFKKVGSEVRDIYPPGNPNQAEVKSFSTLFMPGVIFGFLAVVFLSIGGGLFFSLFPNTR
jgi:hypothetical protein